MAEAPVVYREEVLSIIGAMADLVVYVDRIRDILKGEFGQEEEEDEEGD